MSDDLQLVSEGDDRRVAAFFGLPEIRVDVRPQLATAAMWRGYSRAGMLHPGRNHPGFARELIARYSEPRQLVFDPCAGIGTFLVEALKLGRWVVGWEVEPDYFLSLRENVTRWLGEDPPVASITCMGAQGSATAALARFHPDLVLTSPPFPWEHSPGSTEKQATRLRDKCAHAGTGFAKRAANNLCAPGAPYWIWLEAIYRNCLLISPSNRERRMVVVVRDCVREGAFVPYSRMVGQVMQRAGWILREVVTRKLRPSHGHARRLKDNPAALFYDEEHAIVAERVF